MQRRNAPRQQVDLTPRRMIRVTFGRIPRFEKLLLGVKPNAASRAVNARHSLSISFQRFERRGLTTARCSKVVLCTERVLMKPFQNFMAAARSTIRDPRVPAKPREQLLILAAALATVLTAVGCNDYGNTFQVPTGATISSLSPSAVAAGSHDFTLTVNGSGFVKQTVVQWNGGTIPTQVQTDSNMNVTGITATVAASLVANPGTAYVNTLSPHSGAGTNGLSNTLAFVIDPRPNPIPSLSSLMPDQAPKNSATFTLNISGTNFLPNSDPSARSRVNWIFNGVLTVLPVTSITATQIAATVDQSLLTTDGRASVSVYNPPSSTNGNGGGGTSNALSFCVGTCPAAPASRGGASGTSQAVEPAEQTPAISLDGRYVAYTAVRDQRAQIFLRDTCVGAASSCEPRTMLISADPDGNPGDADSSSPSMSANGRYVAFSSASSNLLSDAPPGRQVYLRDTCLSAPDCLPTTSLISTDADSALDGRESILPSVSASGRFVAFVALSPGSASNSNPGPNQVFVRDTCLGAEGCTPKTTRISLETTAATPALSGDGRRVAVTGDTVMLFKQSVPVDDRVFLAVTDNQP